MQSSLWTSQSKLIGTWISFVLSQYSTTWNYLKIILVLKQTAMPMLALLAPQSKYTLIMREPLSGRSWTSKVFNTVITLDTYQFLLTLNITRIQWRYVNETEKSFSPVGCTKYRISLHNARTATGMDGTLHTDFWKSETSRDIKKSF